MKQSLHLSDLDLLIPSLQFVLDKKGFILHIDEVSSEFLGYSQDELIGSSLFKIINKQDDFNLKQWLLEANKSHPYECQITNRYKKQIWIQLFKKTTTDEGGDIKIFISCRDYSQQKQMENLLNGQKKILELIASGYSLSTSLKELAKIAEEIRPNMICSILLFNKKHTRLYHGAAPSLPQSYIETINQIDIDPCTGSCGAAAHTKKLVIVKDIETDPLWKEYKDFALSYGLRSCWSTPISSSSGDVLGTIGIYHKHCTTPSKEDIYFIETFSYLAGLVIEQAAIKQDREESEQRYKSLFEQNINAVLSLDLDGTFLDLNHAAENLLGYAKTELLQTSFLSVIFPGDLNHIIEIFKNTKEGNPQDFDVRICTKDGKILYLTVTSIPIVVNEVVTGVYAVAKDVTERVESEQTIRQMAFYDALTGLPNRRLFLECVADELISAQENGHMFSILYMDLDHFKHINDSLGHNIGDILLQRAAELLNICIRDKGIICRMGGDEFTVLLPSLHDEQEAFMAAEVILHNFQQAIEVEGYELLVTPSIGIAFYPNGGEDVETLIKHADIAMYEAKKNGKNQYYSYFQNPNSVLMPHILLLNDLRKAIQQDELMIMYQPITDIKTKQITAMEALVRWNHPTRGLIPPSLFIPLAEETGLISMIDEWMMRKACIQSKSWIEQGLRPIRVCVNISAKELQQKEFSQKVKQMLEEIDFVPDLLELEVTESIFMHKEQSVIHNLNELKRMGVRLAIDDFGTGYSSLEYLQRIPAHTIKIAKEFIDGLPGPNYGSIITSTLISLAHQLNMNVVAEGIEQEEQLAYLQEHDCDFVQGYLLSRPISSEQFYHLLVKEQA